MEKAITFYRGKCPSCGSVERREWQGVPYQDDLTGRFLPQDCNGRDKDGERCRAEVWLEPVTQQEFEAIEPRKLRFAA